MFCNQTAECSAMLNTLNTTLVHSQGTLLLLFYTLLAERSCYVLMLQIHKQSEDSDASQVHWLMFGLFIDR